VQKYLVHLNEKVEKGSDYERNEGRIMFLMILRSFPPIRNIICKKTIDGKGTWFGFF
jgi:hypothetical protein